MNEPSKFVYKSTLRKFYGLTPTMIEELGGPDKYRTNPHWRGAPDASLYSVARIEEWVGANRERVERARANRAKRSAAAQAAQERKREERRRETEERRRDALEWANGLVVEVERRLPGTLVEDARRTHPKLTEKALRAHVRHNLTNYDSLRRQLHGSEFRGELERLIRERTDALVQAAIDEWRRRPGRDSGSGP